MDPFDHEAHPTSGTRPKFSIHDPAFTEDARLGRLRTPLLISFGAFGVAMTFGVMGFFAVAMGDAALAGGTRLVAMFLIGAFVLGSIVSSLVLSITVHRGLNRFYGSRA